MQLLAKGALLIRDAKLLDSTAYADFITVLVPYGRGYDVHCIYPSHFLSFVSSC
jgi:hypothetical protein